MKGTACTILETNVNSDTSWVYDLPSPFDIISRPRGAQLTVDEKYLLLVIYSPSLQVNMKGTACTILVANVSSVTATYSTTE